MKYFVLYLIVFYHALRPGARHTFACRGCSSRLFRMVSWPVALTGQSRLTPSPSRRPYAACLHITPFPAVACFPLPKACACRARTCWGFLRPVPAFSGPLPRHSPFPFVVKTIYTYANFTSIKISYMYMLNQKIPPTPRRLGGHARQGTKSPSRGGARRYQKTYGKIY